MYNISLKQMKQATRKQQTMPFLRLKWNVPGLLSHFNKACTPNWKLSLNRRKNNFPGHCPLLIHPSEKDPSPALFWHCDAKKTEKKKQKHLELKFLFTKTNPHVKQGILD